MLASLDAVHTTFEPRSALKTATERVVKKVHLLEQLVLALHSDLLHDTWPRVAECTDIDEYKVMVPVGATVER